MKKETKVNKLNLSKTTIARLNNNEMNEIKGGFTYSLSTGAVCRRSKALTEPNAVACGIRVKLIEKTILNS